MEDEQVAAYDHLLPDLVKIIQNKENDSLKRPGYKASVDHADEMAVHLYGDKPSNLLARVRPREDPDITQYRLESYEPTTKSTAEKAVSLVNKIFNPKLYAIKPKDGAPGKALYEYATVEYPVFNSVVNYLSSYGLKKALADPNGIFLVEPAKNPESPTEQILPIVNCYASRDIWLTGEQYIIIFLQEKEIKSDTGKYIEYYFRYVDKQIISTIVLYAPNSKDFVVREEENYPHLFDEVPAWPLGGAYSQRLMGLQESYFFPAVPFWNKAICAESDLDGAFISHLHPQKWEVADECEFVEHTGELDYPCTGGYIYNPSKTGGKYSCPSCQGTGRKSVKSPYQVYQVAKDKLNDPNGNTLSQPPAGYISVPTEATQMLVDRVDRLLERGLSALNMDIINKIGNNQSGDAKAYDRTELFDFLGKVRDRFYDVHLVNIFYYFAKYMFIKVEPASVEPTVIKPNDFDIYTTQDLVDQLKVSKDSGVNPTYLQAKEIEVVNKEFQSNPDVLPFMNLTIVLDPLAEISRTDVGQMVLDGSVSKKTTVIHDNIREFVRRALEEDKTFGKKKYSEQMEIIGKYAQERMDEIDEQTKIEIDQSAFAEPVGNDPARPPVKD